MAREGLTQLQKRASTWKPTTQKWVTRDQRRLDPIVGFGQAPSAAAIKANANGIRAGVGNVIDLINSSTDMPWWNMEVIEQVRWGLNGPQTDASISKNFGAEIDLFGSGKSPEGIDFVETTMAQTGQTQTFFVACHIGFHMETAPMCWTARGNAWTTPETAVAAPPSPDVWTANDLTNGAISAAIAAGTQNFVPALLDFGWWGNFACWHMARGYNLRWKIGQHINVMDDVLRHTAYMPPNAQEGSASSSEVDIQQFVLGMNARYNELGSALSFLPIDFVRLGSVSSAGEVPVNVGAFTPTRDFDTVPATYGGMDLRSLLRNTSEFRRLNLPLVIRPGVPIGLTLQENDAQQGNAMRQFLSITNNNGQGVIPPIYTPAPNINATFTTGGSGNVMLERQLDGATNTPQQVPVERTLFKAGPLKFSLMIKGFEVPADWFNLLQNNPDIRDVVLANTKLQFVNT